jgi:hypothetical protein
MQASACLEHDTHRRTEMKTTHLFVASAVAAESPVDPER